ncbi:hypothetical protein [Rhodococcus sp. YH1]|uniref:hypothetical protein n=1 Tax=Rhodococcus sp. YH1 TaxID=89066 RepID=UPI001386EEBC|nr:hypothetical protein [Rhodococcus sp. YH1]
MSDLVIPAKVTITREVDLFGLPITRAHLDVDDDTKGLPLPAGRQGDPGPRGLPRAPWIKAGEVATAAALPTGLGPDDRGKWWHDLATDDMWTWNGSEWKQSVGAVGPRGPVAPDYSLDITQTMSNPKMRVAAAELTGGGGAQSMKLTVPAGPKGPVGPIGASGSLQTSTDYNATASGPVNGSLIAYDRITRKLRATPPPGPVGMWAKGPADFPATTALANVETIELVILEIPALPFAWRPRVHGRIATLADSTGGNNAPGYPHVWARLNDWAGPILAVGLNPFRGSLLNENIIRPHYSEQGGTVSTGNSPGHVRLSPTSTVGVVQPYEPARIYVRVERDLGNASTGSQIQYVKTAPYIQVQAMPLWL